MPNPYYRIVGSRVSRSPIDEVSEEAPINPRDFGRGATGQEPVVDERPMVEGLLSGAKGALGRSDILSRQIQRGETLGADQPESYLDRLKRMWTENMEPTQEGGVPRSFPGLLYQTAQSPQGQAMLGETIGPAISASMRGLRAAGSGTGRTLSELLGEVGSGAPKPPMPYKFNMPPKATSPLDEIATGIGNTDEAGRRAAAFGGLNPSTPATGFSPTGSAGVMTPEDIQQLARNMQQISGDASLGSSLGGLRQAGRMGPGATTRVVPGGSVTDDAGRVLAGPQRPPFSWADLTPEELRQLQFLEGRR